MSGEGWVFAAWNAHLLVYECCHRQAVEAVGERLPQPDVVPSLALIIEAVYPIDGRALMVPAEQEKVLWVLDLHSINDPLGSCSSVRQLKSTSSPRGSGSLASMPPDGVLWCRSGVAMAVLARPSGTVAPLSNRKRSEQSSVMHRLGEAALSLVGIAMSRSSPCKRVASRWSLSSASLCPRSPQETGNSPPAGSPRIQRAGEGRSTGRGCRLWDATRNVSQTRTAG